MTLKTTNLIKHLADSKTIREASIKAGYAPKSNKPYRPGIKGYIKEAIGYDPRAIINAYEDFIARCKQDDDKTNERLAYDSLARINAMFKDKHEITTQSLSPADINKEVLEEARAILATSL